MTNSSSFSIIVPAYNEQDGIRESVSEIYKVFSKLGHPFEIIIVNDGSTDDTAGAIAALSAEFVNVQTVTLQKNYGKGYAIREGAAQAGGDYVVFMDADLDIHPRQMDRILELLKRKGCDVAIGSKRHPESVIDYPLSRRIISNIYFWITSLFFGLNVRDTQAGLKIYKKAVLKAILPRLVVKKFAFDLEMLAAAHRLGFGIREFPITVTFSRKYGRISSVDCWRTGVDTLAIFYRHRILDFYSQQIAPYTATPKVSVIISASNPGQDLKNCLAACLMQNYTNFEILALPDSDEASILNQFVGHPKIKLIATGAVDRLAKRNLGAELADGQLLAFIDDNAFPRYDWMRTAVSTLGQKDVGAVTGPSLTPGESCLHERIGGHIAASLLVSGRNRHRFLIHKYRQIDDALPNNFFIQTKLFETTGGFSRKYRPGEMKILCEAVRATGTRHVVYDPHLIVEQRRLPIFKAHLKTLRLEATGNGYLARHWPARFLTATTLLPLFFSLPLAVAFSLLFTENLSWLGSTLWGAYLVSVFLFSLTLSGFKETLLTAIGTIVTHFSYSFYFLKGIGLKRFSTWTAKTVRPYGALAPPEAKKP
jgi:glycosyltransferase involved in cell wall biosynthesis